MLGYIPQVSQLYRSTFNYLCTYNLSGPVRNAFDAGSILYEGKWEGVGHWKSRVFWALWNGIEPTGECHLGPEKPSTQYGPWNLPRGLFTSLVYLWLSYVCVCTWVCWYAHVRYYACMNTWASPGWLLYIKFFKYVFWNETCLSIWLHYCL